MEKGEDHDPFLLDMVDEAMRVREDLPYGWIINFRHLTAAFGKGRQRGSYREGLFKELPSGNW
jgi:hypothetical protein